MQNNDWNTAVIVKESKGKTPKYKVEYHGQILTVSYKIDDLSISRPGSYEIKHYRLVSDVVDQLEYYDYERYKYAPDRNSFDDLPSVDPDDFLEETNKFIKLLKCASCENMIKYVAANAVRKKDGTLYKKRTLPLATYPYTTNYYYDLLAARNKSDTEVEIILEYKDMIFCPNEDEFTIQKLYIVDPSQTDALLSLIAGVENSEPLAPKVKPLFETENGCLKKVNFDSTSEEAEQYLSVQPGLMVKAYNLIVPDVIVSIGDKTFEKCQKLYDIRYKGELKKIGKRAFLGCNHFSGDLPDCISEIGEQAFKQCSKVMFLEIPSGINEIAEETWMECSSLEKVCLGGNVKTIGDRAFKGCVKLRTTNFRVKEFIIPDGVHAIGSEAFAGCTSLGLVKISSTVCEIADDAFAGCLQMKICALKDSYAHKFALSHHIPFVESPEKFEYSGNVLTAYHGIRTSLTLPKPVLELGVGVFRETPLREVELPEGLVKISKKAFFHCEYLRKLSLPSTVVEIEDMAFSYCCDLQQLILPVGLKTIGKSAFRHCCQVKEIDVPQTVEWIGKEAFALCYSLKRVFIRGENTVLAEKAFFGCDDITIIAPKGSLAEEYAQKNECLFEELKNHDEPAAKK